MSRQPQIVEKEGMPQAWLDWLLELQVLLRWKFRFLTSTRESQSSHISRAEAPHSKEEKFFQLIHTAYVRPKNISTYAWVNIKFNVRVRGDVVKGLRV